MVFAPSVLMVTTANSPHHGPPRRLSRLCRCEAVRSGRPRHRRAPLPRPLQRRRLPGQRARHPAVAREGGGGAGPRRPRSGEPQRSGLATDPRDVPPQRAVPDRRRRAVRDRHRHPRPAGPASGPAVHPPRRLRPLRLLPRVPAPGSLLDQPSRRDRRGRPGGLRWHGHRARGPDRHRCARPPARAGGARSGRPPPRDRRRGEAARGDRRRLVGRARGGAGGRAGRGRGAGRAGSVRRRLPRGLPGRLLTRHGGGRRRLAVRDRRRSRPHHVAVPPARRGAGGGQVPPDAARSTARPLRGAAPPGAPRGDRGRRTAPRDPRRRAERVALRHRSARERSGPDRRPSGA